MIGAPVVLAIAVPAAIAAAASFGLTAALQQREARATDRRGAVRWGLVTELARRPMWLGSLVVNGLGIVLQWIAWSTGPLALVQPLLVTGLLFAVVFAGWLDRLRPDRVALFGAGLCVLGLAAFLLFARPSPGRDRLTLGEVVPLAGGLTLVLASCLYTAVRHPGRLRVLALAGATGVCYGVAAGLAKLAADDLRRGVGAMLTDWPFLLLLVCGPLGFLLNQNAFRAGVAPAPALSVIVLVDPLVSIGIGTLWLGESLSADPGEVVGQVFALGVMATGVGVLSRRAPQVARDRRSSRTGKRGPPVSGVRKSDR
ncbi:MAG: DMT family transporter [Kutzneria sp.]|nr:DMT family transporter [Kutzneria sp.]